MSDSAVTQPEAAEKRKTPFATHAQNWVLGFLILSMLLVAQPFSIEIFGYGVYLLAIAVFLQIGVSNVAPSAGARKTITKTLIILAVIAVIFAFSIWVTPMLVQMGR